MKSKPNDKPQNPEPAAATQEKSLPQIVQACWASKPFMDAMIQTLHQADAAALRERAVCLGGGACCKFDLAGHRLYISTGELALLCRQPPPAPARYHKLRCPYQRGPRCLGRPRRPLGCRTYFCDPALVGWYAQTYETFHLRIRQLHDQFRIDYRYVELTRSIATLYSPDSCKSASE
jgi:hypothetical protein